MLSLSPKVSPGWSALPAISKSKFPPILQGLYFHVLLCLNNIYLQYIFFLHFYSQLVAVERIEEYARKNPEAPAETDVALPENWPQAGHVEFRNHSTRYREGLDLVIKN